MNVLTDGLPYDLEVDGVLYPIDADFRNCLLIHQAFEDPALTNWDKQYLMVKLLYDEEPHDFAAAIQPAVDFLNCDSGYKVQENIRVFSFTHDDKFIRSAIQDKKGCNLDELEFWHWWDFYYFFFGLKDTYLNELMGVRYRLQKGNATKEDREYARKNADIVSFPTQSAASDPEQDEFMARYKAAKARQGR